MALFDIIAAGHRGQCFALLARRFLISEPQAAEAVRALLPVVLPSFEAWLSAPGGVSGLLDMLSRGGYERALKEPNFLSNHFERERGVQLLDTFRSAREFDGAGIAQAVEASGLTYRILLQMLPYVAMFAMAALRSQAEAPFRDMLARRLGARARASADPFAELADLVAWEAKGDRQGVLSSMLDGLFRRRPDETSNLALGTASASPA